MLRSFLVITFRILWRNKVTSFVNIFSLGVGITAFIFIMLYVHHETSYDKFNANYDRIYRLEGDDYARLSPIMATLVKERVPEVENIAQIVDMGLQFVNYIPGDPERQKQLEMNLAFADASVFDVFTFPIIRGKQTTALHAPFQAVFTKSAAKRLFGDSDPINQVVEYQNHQFTVVGVMADILHSHIEADVFLSKASVELVYPLVYSQIHKAPMAWIWGGTYLLINREANLSETEEKINKALAEVNVGKFNAHFFDHFHVRPLSEIYFNGNVLKHSYGIHGNLKMVQILGAIAVFLLVLAVINYINLTTARSVIRAKEVAVKRLTGSSAWQMRAQLIMESVLISLISMIAAITFIQLFLPAFNKLTGIYLSTVDLHRPIVWLFMVGGTLLMGILAGIYPSVYLTKIQPVKLVKGQSIRGTEGSFLRSLLMTFQFSLSVIMIIAILVNALQLRFVRTQNLGFNRSNILTVQLPDNFPDKVKARKSFKEGLLRHQGIEKVAMSSTSPGFGEATAPHNLIEDKEIEFKFILCDDEYLDLMGIETVEGRGFSKSFPGDEAKWHSPSRAGGIIFNESTVREFGIEEPVGKILNGINTKRYFEIVGVVKDFHTRSLHYQVEPYCLIWSVDSEDAFYMANIKLSDSDIPAALKSIEHEWKRVYGQKPFAYKFLDENFDRQYKKDDQLAETIGYFTVIALIIACLGLFALSSFMVSRRVKEIGVRKVMGASVATIYSMLSWDFLKWILVAIVIATPVAWYLMKMWLSTFAYHIDLSADVFVIGALIAIGIALLTVTGQSLKVARANPIESLRYE